MPSDSEILSALEQFALSAGRAVMHAFDNGCTVEAKADDTPVTWADREAERLILAGLAKLCPHIPCVAEEAAACGSVPADPGDEFLLVDPLDGTREFVSRRRDFTINIALIRSGVPVLGVVFAPASRVMYSGAGGRAERMAVDEGFGTGARLAIRVRAPGPVPTVLVSRSHRSEATDRYVSRLSQAELVSIGSSLKFCMLAEGQADIYPRFGRTMQWDTAAGDAVLRAAGGMTATLEGTPLVYGPNRGAESERYANPDFIARGAAA